MDNRELAKVIIVSRGGVAKSADFVAPESVQLMS